MSSGLTSHNLSELRTDICVMTDSGCTTEYREHVVSVIILATVSLLFLTSVLINVTIVIIHIKTSSLRTISNR